MLPEVLVSLPLHPKCSAAYSADGDAIRENWIAASGASVSCRAGIGRQYDSIRLPAVGTWESVMRKGNPLSEKEAVEMKDIQPLHRILSGRERTGQRCCLIK
jgi:hypothetical protein